MKSILRIALAVALWAGIAPAASAQISGTVFIPSLAYPTLDSVVKALNIQGVGAGGLTINMTVDETAPAGGYRLGSAVLNSSLAVAKPLVINGNNRQITGQTGVGNNDGVFLLSGTDYVTIDGFKIIAAGGTNDAERIEWGIALLKRSATAPYDGCQNVTIRNCAITLGGATLSTGIYLNHSLATSGATLSTAGAVAGDANSNITITRDSLMGAVRGVVTSGISTAGARDYNNLIGGTTASDGNYVMLAQNATTGYGTYAVYDSVLTVNNNSFQNITGQTGNFNLITLGNSRGNITIQNNRLDLTNDGTGNAVTGFFNAAPGALPNSGLDDTSAIFIFSNNTLTGSNSNANNGTVYGFRSVGMNARRATVTDNTISNINWGSAFFSGSVYALDYTAGAADSVNVSSNTIADIIKNGSGFGSLYTATVRNTGGTGTRGLTYESNRIQRITADNALFGHYVESRTALNQTTRSRLNITDSLYLSKPFAAGIFTSYMSSRGLNSEVANNSVRRIAGAFGANIEVYWAQGDQNPAIHDNLVDSINGGNGTIRFNTDVTVGGGSYYLNTVRNVTNAAGMVYGAYFSPVTSTASFNVYNNLITNLSKTGTGGARHRGIYGNGTGIMSVYNNTVSNLNVNVNYNGNADDLVGIYVGNTGTYRLLHNTVRIATAGSPTTFSATGVFYENGANTLLRNNLINVNCAPAGNGTVVALRRLSGTAGTAPANLNDTTNNNVYYAPDAANSYWYAEGTLTSNVVNAFRLSTDPSVNGSCSSSYKALMMPRERSSFVENNLVAVGTAGLFAPTGASYAKRNAVRQSGLPAITNDQNNVARPPAADVGTLQFTGTPLDGTAPSITIVNPLSNFCYITQRVAAVIRDTSGVRRGAGTQPRLYYIKTTSSNTFTVPNTAAGNGWKWVEPAAIVGDTFFFVPNYAILNGGIVPGDAIAYFVVAQDSAVTPNVAYRTTTFPATYCPASVDLSAAPPVTSTPANAVTVTFSDKTVTPAGPITFCARNVISATQIDTNKVVLKAVVAANLTYQWKRGTTVLAGETKDSIVVSTSGNYSVVIVNNAFGCRDSSAAVSVTVTSGPAATISPSPTASTCATDSVRLITNNASGLTYTWYRNDTLIAGAVDSFYFAKVGGSYKVRVSSGAMCSNITGVPTVVTINAFPLPTAAITNNTPATFCDGDSVILRTGSAPGLTYQWRRNNVVIAGATDSLYTAKLGGDYTVRITTSDGCNRTSAIKTVVVNPIPAAAISPASSAFFCANASVTLSAAPAPPGFTYQWKLGGTNITGATGATYSTNVVGSYTVQVTSTAGCTKLSTAVAVTSSPLPVVTITSSPTNTTVCAGNTVTLTGNNITGRSYQWLLNNAPITGATSLSYGATASGSYRLKATINATSCTDTSTAIVVTVNPLPVVVIATTGTSPICANDSIVLKVASPVNTSFQYQWRYNNTNIPSATDTVYTARNNSGAYTVRATNPVTGCVGTSAPFNLVVNPLPVTNITYNSPLSFCEGGGVVLNAQAPAGATLSWYRNGTQIQPIVSTSFYLAQTSGSYTVRVISAAGCLYTSNAVPVTVFPLPAPIITRSNDTLFAGPQTYLTYQWYRNGSIISGANNSFYRVTTNAGYSVQVSDANGCENTSSTYSFGNVGLGSSVAKGTIKIYPNPTTGFVKVEAPVAVDITVRDATGRVVRTLKGANEIEFGDLADGLYLVYLTDAKTHEALYTEKITKVSR